jgi:hypothetical protein
VFVVWLGVVFFGGGGGGPPLVDRYGTVPTR